MKNCKKILKVLLYVFVIHLLLLPSFIFKQFGQLDLEQLLFLFMSDGAGADLSVVKDFFLYTIPVVLVIFMLYFVMHLFNKRFGEKIKNLKWFGKLYSMTWLRTLLSKSISRVVLVVVMVALFLNSQFNVSGYILNSQDTTYLYEVNYIDPDNVEITFPDEKRNLVYIVLESLNTNFGEIEIDGDIVDLIPNIKALANSNVSFSHSTGFGGFQHLRGMTWTVASLVGQTSGVPLNVPLKNNKYGTTGHFLPGIKTMGEILADNGYSNYFLMGSDGDFGGRQTYFETHGDYEIIDTKYLKETGYIPEDYDVFWGMEDLKLFDVAKAKLTEVAEKGEPFNFSLLTVDTHYPIGYVDETCDLTYDNDYANAIQCSDLKIIEFVKWIQQQDFYENTTVILTGDHETMNNEFLNLSVQEEKRMYNTFLNLPFEVDADVLVNREFSALDMFPTTLVAMGAQIEGDRLGLGSNLFSGKSTLIEKYGVDYLDEEFGKKSDYYNMKFFIKELDEE